MQLSNKLDIAHQQKVPAATEAKGNLEDAVETLEELASIDPRFGSPIGRILEAIFQIDGILIEEAN